MDQLLADETMTSLSSAGSVQYPLGDQLGTLCDLASHDSGTHVTSIDNHRRYDDYGNLVSESNATIDQLFGYTGRAFDDSTGLQNNLNRWCDPKSGRWMSEDPIAFRGDPSNLYRYVGNSPTNRTDPSGTITVTTMGNPQKSKLWLPGGFEVNWRFRMDRPAPQEGYIVQKVEWIFNYVDAKAVVHFSWLAYYEVWHVPAGWNKTDEEHHRAADNDTDTDTAIDRTRKDGGAGLESQDGEIKFFTCDIFDPKKLGFRGNLIMTVDGNPNARPADTLLALKGSIAFDALFFAQPSSNGEKTGYRGVTVTWPPRLLTVNP